MIEIVGVPLTQWDVNRKVEVTGEAEYVHFANAGDSKAVKLPLIDGMSEIPEYLLQTGKALNVYAVLDGVTLESRSFAVRKRERPEDYIYEDDQRNYIYELIDDVNEAIKNANDAAEELREAIKNGDIVIPEGGGAEVLNVWVEGTEADHTSGEIFDHVSNVRGPVQLQYNDMYYQLLRADDCVAWFGYIDDEGFANIVCVNGNEIEEYHFDYVPASHFDKVIGDISTALDSIIAMQEELIGV